MKNKNTKMVDVALQKEILIQFSSNREMFSVSKRTWPLWLSMLSMRMRPSFSRAFPQTPPLASSTNPFLEYLLIIVVQDTPHPSSPFHQTPSAHQSEPQNSVHTDQIFLHTHHPKFQTLSHGHGPVGFWYQSDN